MADFLDQAFPTGEAAPEPDPVETPAPEVVQPVVPVEAPEPEPAPTPEPAPEPAKETQHAIPIATALQWRDEAKENKRRLEAIEAERRQQAAVPDSFDDPQAFNAYVTSQMDERVTNLRFQMSEAMAKQVHGAETVDTAAQWAAEKAQADPAFALSYMRDPNPMDWIVRQHKREALLSDIGDNVDDWFTREAAKRGYAQSSAVPAVAIPVAATPAVKPAAPPRSIASQAPASAAAPSDNNAEFMAIFKR